LPVVSATSCSPIAIGAVGATTRWQALLCIARWVRPSDRQSCDVRAAKHISTRCMRVLA
jgi:hypothetical protein